MIRAAILPPENGTFVTAGVTGHPVLSPDGRSVAFIAQVAGVTQLWVRDLDSFKPRALASTEDAYGAFWSPDGRNLGFFAQGKLKRIAVGGGPAVTLCDVDQGRGGSWNQQDVIIFGKFPGEIYSVPSAGGVPRQVTHLDASRHHTTHRWPYFLPDGNRFIYMAFGLGTASEEDVFSVGSLDGKVDRVLSSQAGSPIAYDSGYLLYIVEKTLMARPFDPNKLAFSGEAVPVAEGVQADIIYVNGVFSASGNGVLLYQTGNSLSKSRLHLVDSSGKTVGNLGDLSGASVPRISPEGKRVAITIIEPNSGRTDVWVQDIASGNRTRLTVDPRRSFSPVWSRDGERIAYLSNRTGKPALFAVASNGMGVEQKLWESAVATRAMDWTTDSKSVIVQERAEGGKARLVLIPVEGKAEAMPLLEGVGANVYGTRLSADGHWIAYDSDVSGKLEVYVSAFPKPEGRLQISLAGGRFPTWNSNGKELYYLDTSGSLMAAELKQSNGSLQVASRRILFPLKFWLNDSYDAFPDGKRFLLSTSATEEPSTPLNLVVNWTAELKK